MSLSIDSKLYCVHPQLKLSVRYSVIVQFIISLSVDIDFGFIFHTAASSYKFNTVVLVLFYHNNDY